MALSLKRPARFLYRFPITTRTVIFVFVLGFLVWIWTDYLGREAVKRVMEMSVREGLNDKALDYRVNFVRFVNAYNQIAKVIASQGGMETHLDSPGWQEDGFIEHKSYPAWMPSKSLLRSFGSPRFFILMDPQGKVREVYNAYNDVPEGLLEMNPRTVILSKGESHLTLIEGRPFLITSEPAKDTGGREAALLMLASPIDERFLLSSQSVPSEDIIIALLDKNENVIASSDSGLIPDGAQLHELKKQYLVIGQEFLEYGGSELYFRFSSLVHKDTVKALMAPVVSKDRVRHLLHSLTFLLVFATFMYLNARRIKEMTVRITDYSRRNLGGQHHDAGKWDEMYILEERFKLLTGEILSAAETIRAEESEKARREEELAGKERQLNLLQAVTEATGIGVAINSGGTLKPINSKMEYYSEMYGEPECFNIREGTEREIEVEFRDGTRHVFNVMAPNLDMGEKVVLASDITEGKRAMEAIIESRNDWESTFNSITDIITIHDSKFNIIAANDAALKHLDLPLLDREKAKCYRYYHGTDAPPESCASCKCLVTGKPTTVEFYEPHLEMFIELRAIPRFDSKGNVNGIIHVMRDISGRKRLEEELRRRALFDSLTGLPNKVLFMDRLQNLFRHRQRQKDLVFAVMFLDIDNFKKVNDVLGHIVGDELLVSVSSRLAACIRPGDTVSRFGGDEFIILLDGISGVEESTAISERIRLELMEPFKVETKEIYITSSIGIAPSSMEYGGSEEMIRDADIAMYHAKARGKDCHMVFSEHMRSRVVEALNLESDLRHALRRDELLLAFQPIVDIHNDSVSGFEALLRWNHPAHGLVRPEKFVPVAEETGLIVPIGEWVIMEACRQIAQWQGRALNGSDFYISVNVSPRQFSPGLPDAIEQGIREFGIGPGRLRIEITETLLMENPDIAADLLSKIKGMGVRVYLDDFGTGYSSLHYIHNFHIDGLKIDRSFIRNLEGRNSPRQIIKAILALADSLGIDVIVEGVEDRENLDILRSLGCRYIQGYVFSRPLHKAKAEDFTMGFTLS